MKRVLIDSDVILDFFFDRKPFSIHASAVLALCECGQIKGFITPVICSNMYYLLRRTAKHEKVVEKLKQLTSIIGVLTMNSDTTIQALNSGFRDFEDALQYHAATVDGTIDLILTRNTKDYKSSELGVMTPESYVRIYTKAE